jgi:hypothetical protein
MKCKIFVSFENVSLMSEIRIGAKSAGDASPYCGYRGPASQHLSNTVTDDRALKYCISCFSRQQGSSELGKYKLQRFISTENVVKLQLK